MAHRLHSRTLRLDRAFGSPKQFSKYMRSNGEVNHKLGRQRPPVSRLVESFEFSGLLDDDRIALQNLGDSGTCVCGDLAGFTCR